MLWQIPDCCARLPLRMSSVCSQQRVPAGAKNTSGAILVQDKPEPVAEFTHAFHAPESFSAFLPSQLSAGTKYDNVRRCAPENLRLVGSKRRGKYRLRPNAGANCLQGP